LSQKKEASADKQECEKAQEALRFYSIMLANAYDAVVGYSLDKEIVKQINEAGRVEGESTRSRKDGRELTVEFRSVLIRVVDGSPTGYVSFDRDITERKKTKENVQRVTEELCAFVLTSSDDVVYRMSPDWTQMTYLRGANFIPDTDKPSENWVEKYILPEDRTHVSAVIQQAIETKSVFELEHRVIRVDGSVGWTFSRAVPLLDKKGKEIVEWFGTAKDVTERKEKDRLAAIGATAGMVGHDIRSPLQAIAGALYLLSSDMLRCLRVKLRKA
jgi:PAS domain-containing protein